MSCELCNIPNNSGDFDPCCNLGTCTAEETKSHISNCICCGGEMFKDRGFWFHNSQVDIKFEERRPQNS